MADNISQATVSPELPASLFNEQERESLSFACGLACEPNDDRLYFFADHCFSEEDEDSEGARVNCTLIFQEKLKLLPAGEYPYVIIEGAATCTKMREGEFGGFAYFITRTEVRYVSTWQWVHEQTIISTTTGRSLAGVDSALPEKPYSVLLLYPDYANDNGTETYYALVEASDPIAAVTVAREQVVVANDCVGIDDPDDFSPLLVTEGHHPSQPLFNR